MANPNPQPDDPNAPKGSSWRERYPGWDTIEGRQRTADERMEAARDAAQRARAANPRGREDLTIDPYSDEAKRWSGDPLVDPRDEHLNPATIVPRQNVTNRIAGVVIGIVLLVVLFWFMFHNFMSPERHHPGGAQQDQGLEKRLP